MYDDTRARVRSIVLAPSYRGRVTKTAPSKVAVRVWANLPRKIPLLRARLRRAAADGGAVLAEVQVEWPRTTGTQHVDLIFPHPPQPLMATPGRYTLEVQCLDPHGAGGAGSNTTAVLAEATHTLTRVADDAPEPPAWIDGQQRLIVDGAPFFPLGLYVIIIMHTSGKIKPKCGPNFIFEFVGLSPYTYAPWWWWWWWWWTWRRR